MSKKIERSEEHWRRQLTPEQFHICRNKGTEPPFTGKYYDCHSDGTYECICCGSALFHSDAKFNSGSGWPSFSDVIHEDVIEVFEDTSHGMIRVEITCRICAAHLGHVFEDGPDPTGLRYCVNSASLLLKEDES